MQYDKTGYTKAISAIWSNWAVAFGAISLIVLMSLWITHVWLPVLVIGVMAVVMAYARRKISRHGPACMFLSRYAVRILFCSAIVMFVINMLNIRWISGPLIDLDNYNGEIPFISSLILFPVSVIISGYGLLRIGKTRECAGCKEVHGYSVEDGFVGSLFHSEAVYQSRMLFMISLFLTVVQWGYYSLFYINVNINTPDRFFYVVVPVVIYILSLVYLGIRYSGFISLTDDGTSGRLKDTGSIVRFLVLKGDRLLLKEISVQGISAVTRWDTPATDKIPYERDLGIDKAKAVFERVSGVKDAEIKAIYNNESLGMGSNAFHFAAIVPEDNGYEISGGAWVTLYEIDDLSRKGGLSPALSSELSRIFTITMAWKTYDRQGRRLYPIKNYRPTFRLRDFKDWDVDYNDLHWLRVASDNQDRPFYSVRRLWRKYINGFSD